MQNENRLSAAHTRAAGIRAANRNGNSGELSELEPVIEKRPSGWRKHLPRWETLTMPSGRTVEKGFVVSPTIATLLLGTLISAIGWSYASNTKDSRETREAVIRMETMLNERTQTFKEQQAEFKQQLDTERRVAELQREKQRDEMRDFKAEVSGISKRRRG